jgi:hypothetical protein
LPFGSGRRHQDRTQGGYDAIQRSICSHRFPSAVAWIWDILTEEKVPARATSARANHFLRRAGRGAAHAALNPASGGNPNLMQRQTRVPSKRLIRDFDHPGPLGVSSRSSTPVKPPLEPVLGGCSWLQGPLMAGRGRQSLGGCLAPREYPNDTPEKRALSQRAKR